MLRFWRKGTWRMLEKVFLTWLQSPASVFSCSLILSVAGGLEAPVSNWRDIVNECWDMRIYPSCFMISSIFFCESSEAESAEFAAIFENTVKYFSVIWGTCAR